MEKGETIGMSSASVFNKRQSLFDRVAALLASGCCARLFDGGRLVGDATSEVPPHEEGASIKKRNGYASSNKKRNGYASSNLVSLQVDARHKDGSGNWVCTTLSRRSNQSCAAEQEERQNTSERSLPNSAKNQIRGEDCDVAMTKLGYILIDRRPAEPRANCVGH